MNDDLINAAHANIVQMLRQNNFMERLLETDDAQKLDDVIGDMTTKAKVEVQAALNKSIAEDQL